MASKLEASNRLGNAWKARKGVPKTSVLKRSQGVLRVLSALSREEAPITAGDLAPKVEMKIRNTNRILLSLFRYGQVVRFSPNTNTFGRQSFLYQITPRGVGRMKWLRKNKPWE